MMGDNRPPLSAAGNVQFVSCDDARPGPTAGLGKAGEPPQSPRGGRGGHRPPGL